MSIVRKMTLGYVILIFVPVLVFGYFYYSQIYSNLTHQFVQSRQKIVEQAYANMKMDLTRIDSIQRMLQYNPYVTDYLDGVYASDQDSIYAYNRYISPLITQSLLNNPEIERFHLYKTKPQVLSITDRLLDMADLDPQGQEAVRSLPPGRGVWLLPEPQAELPALLFYQHIYNADFTEVIGLLELRINGSLIHKLYDAAGGRDDWQVLLLPAKGVPLTVEKRYPNIAKATWQQLGSSEVQPYFINRKRIVNQLYIEELDARIVVTGKVVDVFRTIKRKEMLLVLTVLALLVILSFVYYALASTITKRILLLARHMRNLDDDNMKPLLHKREQTRRQDEIGFLTATYNAMIHRMDELINNVHRSELRNKEAAYRVLQAQIKPHFLYNTLETIRMLAEANNDQQVADISFWFGKLMRYSLSSEGDHTVLAKEVETVVFYLNIHKMRLQHRITYELDVTVDAERIACPRFILQPLVENCIVHAVAAVRRPVHIKLAIHETEEEMCISITDNGAGMASDKLMAIRYRLARGDEPNALTGKEGSLGLFNVSERIKSFYGGSSRLVLDSGTDWGTCLSLIISKERMSRT